MPGAARNQSTDEQSQVLGCFARNPEGSNALEAPGCAWSFQAQPGVSPKHKRPSRGVFSGELRPRKPEVDKASLLPPREEICHQAALACLYNLDSPQLLYQKPLDANPVSLGCSKQDSPGTADNSRLPRLRCLEGAPGPMDGLSRSAILSGWKAVLTWFTEKSLRLLQQRAQETPSER